MIGPNDRFFLNTFYMTGSIIAKAAVTAPLSAYAAFTGTVAALAAVDSNAGDRYSCSSEIRGTAAGLNPSEASALQ